MNTYKDIHNTLANDMLSFFECCTNDHWNTGSLFLTFPQKGGIQQRVLYFRQGSIHQRYDGEHKLWQEIRFIDAISGDNLHDKYMGVRIIEGESVTVHCTIITTNEQTIEKMHKVCHENMKPEYFIVNSKGMTRNLKRTTIDILEAEAEGTADIKISYEYVRP